MAKNKKAGAAAAAPAAQTKTQSAPAAETKKSYQLADPSGGFWDGETGLKIVRDQVAEIDTSKRVGRLTTGAIRAGRLIEVNLAPAKSKEQGGEE